MCKSIRSCFQVNNTRYGLTRANTINNNKFTICCLRNQSRIGGKKVKNTFRREIKGVQKIRISAKKHQTNTLY